MPADLELRLAEHGQQHLLRFWSELSPSQQEELRRQIAAIDFDELSRLVRIAAQRDSACDRAARSTSPARVVRVGADRHDSSWRAARAAGEELLRAGCAGAILVAGGEGTRLGFPHPKGMFPIGPVSGKSLYQLLAEQLAARSRRHGAQIPCLVMTSDATHDPTITFFERHGWFGLDPAKVRFFRQGNMPAVDRATGRVLMQSRHAMAQSPDGHGGLLAAMRRAGLFAELRGWGVEHLFYYQVDNPLVNVCDPAFLGFHLLERADVTTKVVRKLSAAEKMGVVVDVDGSSQIIEYSDLPAGVAGRLDARGEWVFWAGNTAMHLFRAAFLEEVVSRGALPFHCAVKKVSCLDDSGKLFEPATENAVKFEKFIFDVLPLAERHLVVETLREEEFCPLKNPSGDFGPEDVRRALARKFRGWLRAAGHNPPDSLTVEISASLALEPDDLLKHPSLELNRATPLLLE